jgi:hypothetical protein
MAIGGNTSPGPAQIIGADANPRKLELLHSRQLSDTRDCVAGTTDLENGSKGRRILSQDFSVKFIELREHRALIIGKEEHLRLMRVV